MLKNCTYEQEFTNEELMELEIQKIADKFVQPDEEMPLKRFTIKDLAEVFSQLEQALVLFEEMAPDTTLFTTALKPDLTNAVPGTCHIC
jgi:hypothetical protein